MAGPWTRASLPRRSEWRSGFTLLEVLAAVAILGVWYIVLAAMSADGLRKEGETHRRVQASLIADQMLSEYEVATIAGSAPTETNDSSEQDLYTIEVRVEPFVSEQATVPPDIQPPTEINPTAASPDLTSLVSTQTPDVASYLRSIHIEVSWEEGAARRSVNRTSYAFDLTNAAGIYEEMGLASERSTEEEEGVGDDEEEDLEASDQEDEEEDI